MVFFRYHQASDSAPAGAPSEVRLMVQHNRMRWYNPKLCGFEWREMPEDDEGAFALLGGHQHAEADAGVYREWRDLGAGVAASLIRAGETARERNEG